MTVAGGGAALPHRLGHRHRIVADVRLHLRELAAVGVVAGAGVVELPVVVPALVRVPGDRPLHVAERHLLGGLVLDVEVAERRLVHRGLDALNLVLRVDRRLDAVLAEHRDRDDVHLLGRDDVAVAAHLDLLPPPDRLRVGARQPRGLEEPGRVQPQVELIPLGILGRHGHRLAAFAVDVPARARR